MQLTCNRDELDIRQPNGGTWASVSGWDWLRCCLQSSSLSLRYYYFAADYCQQTAVVVAVEMPVLLEQVLAVGNVQDVGRSRDEAVPVPVDIRRSCCHFSLKS